MEEVPAISLKVDMDGNRLDMSVNKDEVILTANIDFWASIYARLIDVFEDLVDAEDIGDGT